MEDYNRNIKEFMKKHGIDGFLEIYFTKFLFKALKFQMKSKLEDTGILKDDPGIAFYIKNKKIGTAEDINKFEGDLMEICNKATKEVIKKLKQDKEFNDLFKGDIEKIKDERVEKEFIKKLHEIIMELKYLK